jgi:hypothetical protein
MLRHPETSPAPLRAVGEMMGYARVGFLAVRDANPRSRAAAELGRRTLASRPIAGHRLEAEQAPRPPPLARRSTIEGAVKRARRQPGRRPSLRRLAVMGAAAYSPLRSGQM